MRFSLFVNVVVFLITLVPYCYGDDHVTANTGYRLHQNTQYVIVASKSVRQDQTYDVYITLLHMPHTSVRVRCTLSNDGEQYASQTDVFYSPSTKRLQLKVPEFVFQGHHLLTVEGLTETGVGDVLFRNTTQLHFYTKHKSIFVQTDRPLYHQKETVNFRVIGTDHVLRPTSGTMTVYLLDGKQNIVRRWLQKQLIFGIFEGEFFLNYPLNKGLWTIRVDAFGHIYNHQFRVEVFHERRFQLNITTPLHIMDTEWGVAGTLYAEHTVSRKPFIGNGYLKLRVKNPETEQYMDGEIVRSFQYMEGQTPFQFLMKEITDKFGDVTGKDLIFESELTDWLLIHVQGGHGRTRVIKDGVRVKAMGRRFRTFKPGTPFDIYFTVSRPDSTPYINLFNRQLYIQTNHEGVSAGATPPEKQMHIPDDGIVKFTVEPGPGDRKITVWAWHPSSPMNKEEVEFFKFHSPGNKYISISSSTEQPTVDEYIVFTVKMNFYTDFVQYLVVSSGRILLGDSLLMSSTQKTFSLAISRAMSPWSRLVVYAIEGSEVITDAFVFPVIDTRLTSASLALNYGKDFHGDHVEMIARGVPGAFISTTAVNYELYSRGFHSFLDTERVLEDLAEYDSDNQVPLHHMWNSEGTKWQENVFLSSATDGIDATTTFDLSGLVMLSDTNFTEYFVQAGGDIERNQCNSTLGFARCLNGACYELKQKCDGLVQCEDGYDEIGCPHSDADKFRRPPDLEYLYRTTRHFSGVKWLWKNNYIKPNGQVEFQVDVPQDNSLYAISGFILHPEEGLAIVKHVQMHDATRLFYMTVEAPGKIKLGEQVGIQLCLFNNWDQDIEAIVTLHGREEYRFVLVEQNGIVNSYNPRTLAGDIQTMVSLASKTSRYLHMPIVPVIPSGTLKIRFSAFSIIDRDEQEITINVEFDGVTNMDHTPYMIDLVNKGSQMVPDFEIPIPERFVQPQQRYHLYVPGSGTAVYSLFADVVSPGFTGRPLTTYDVVGITSDSGDGCLFDFAINLQTLKYLQAVNALDSASEEMILAYLSDLYMRQFTYMQDDGSFKLFRKSQASSIWATSNVLRAFHSAQVSLWNEILYLPISTLNKIAIYLSSVQHEDGYFEETSQYDRNMDPITVDNDGQEHLWWISVTSHVTITLASCTRLSGEAKSKVDTAKQKASDYLASKITYITDPYQMAMVTYTLYQTNHAAKDAAFGRLYSMRREGEFIYWAHLEIAPNPTKIVNTINYMLPRDDYINTGNAVIATSYALMVYLERNEFEESKPIMRWLNTQRIGLMAWSSTQDTLIALEALSTFALTQSNREFYQMEVRIESTSSPQWAHTRRINQTNFGVLFEGQIPKTWGQMKTFVMGTGYAMLQMDFSWNVEQEFQLAGPSFDTFDIFLDEKLCSGRNCSSLWLTPCVRWLRTDLYPTAGLTWISVGIPSGYYIPRNTKERLYAEKIPHLKRFVFRNGNALIFWSKVGPEKQCARINAERYYPIANVSIQHSLQAFEYAENGIQKNKLYTEYTLFQHHICQVCGSFQCPYCPFYNTATAIHDFMQMYFIITLFSSICVMFPGMISCTFY